MGCHFILQGIFSTQESNSRLLCLLHWKARTLSAEPLGKHSQFSRSVMSDSLHKPSLFLPKPKEQLYAIKRSTGLFKLRVYL